MPPLKTPLLPQNKKRKFEAKSEDYSTTIESFIKYVESNDEKLLRDFLQEHVHNSIRKIIGKNTSLNPGKIIQTVLEQISYRLLSMNYVASANGMSAGAGSIPATSTPPSEADMAAVETAQAVMDTLMPAGDVMLTMLMCKQLLLPLKAEPNADYFLSPVDDVALNLPDYKAIVKKPMDLGTIQRKLELNRYSSAGEFVEDTRLVWSNARLYNPVANLVHQAAIYFLVAFERALHQAVNPGEPLPPCLQASIAPPPRPPAAPPAPVLVAGTRGNGMGASAAAVAVDSEPSGLPLLEGAELVTLKYHKVVRILRQQPEAKLFRDPVNWQNLGLSDYPNLVSNPMDLGTVLRKVERREYETVDALRADVDLIWANAITFYGEGSWIKKYVDKMRTISERKINEADARPLGAAPRATTQIFHEAMVNYDVSFKVLAELLENIQSETLIERIFRQDGCTDLGVWKRLLSTRNVNAIKKYISLHRILGEKGLLTLFTHAVSVPNQHKDVFIELKTRLPQEHVLPFMLLASFLLALSPRLANLKLIFSMLIQSNNIKLSANPQQSNRQKRFAEFSRAEFVHFMFEGFYNTEARLRMVGILKEMRFNLNESHDMNLGIMKFVLEETDFWKQLGSSYKIKYLSLMVEKEESDQLDLVLQIESGDSEEAVVYSTMLRTYFDSKKVNEFLYLYRKLKEFKKRVDFKVKRSGRTLHQQALQQKEDPEYRDMVDIMFKDTLCENNINIDYDEKCITDNIQFECLRPSEDIVINTNHFDGRATECMGPYLRQLAADQRPDPLSRTQIIPMRINDLVERLLNVNTESNTIEPNIV